MTEDYTDVDERGYRDAKKSSEDQAADWEDVPTNPGPDNLRVDFDDAQLDQLPKHPTERWLSRRQITRLAPPQCNHTVFPQLCIRAFRIVFYSPDSSEADRRASSNRSATS